MDKRTEFSILGLRVTSTRIDLDGEKIEFEFWVCELRVLGLTGTEKKIEFSVLGL